MKRLLPLLFWLFTFLVSCTPDGQMSGQPRADSDTDPVSEVDTFSVKRPQQLTDVQKQQLATDRKEADSVVNNAATIIRQGDVDVSDKIPDAVGVVSNPDVPPSFPGGSDAMDEYIRKKKIYPLVAFQNDIHGTVKVSFVIESDGRIGGIKVLQGIGYGCDESATELIRSMPKWVPGKKGGAPVRCSVILPVYFGS